MTKNEILEKKIEKVCNSQKQLMFVLIYFFFIFFFLPLKVIVGGSIVSLGSSLGAKAVHFQVPDVNEMSTRKKSQ